MRRRGFTFTIHDVRQPAHYNVDRIYNLACVASPRLYAKDPIKTTTTSVLGTLNLLDLAARTGARFLQASTSEIYGDPLEHPQRESYHGNVNPIGPRACYDEGKRCAETLCVDYRRCRDVDARIVRIFNTYGPRMAAHDGRVIPAFIMRALAGEPLTVQGDGRQTRAFCFVDDMVEGLVRAMDSDAVGGEPINLGQPDEMTVGELAAMIQEMTGSSSSIIHTPLPQDDPMRRRPDIERARRILDWSPTVPLRNGLERTIEWFQRGSSAKVELARVAP